MFCRYCGKEVLPNAKYCQYCGKPVLDERMPPNQSIKQEQRVKTDQQPQFEHAQPEAGNKKRSSPVAIILALLIAAELGAILIFSNLKSNHEVAPTVGGPEYDVVLPDIVLYDKNNVTVKAKGFFDENKQNNRYESYNVDGSVLYIEIQNNRSNAIELQATSEFLVNGYELPYIGMAAHGYTEPGKTNICKIVFEDQYLDPLNINEVSSVYAKLRIFGVSGKHFDDTSEGTEIVIREEDVNEPPEGDLVYNENGIRITYLDYKEGGDYYNAFFLVENASEKDITLSEYRSTKAGICENHYDIDYAAGTKGIMLIGLRDYEHGIGHDKVEYMDVSIVIHEKETGDLMGGFDNYRIHFS